MSYLQVRYGWPVFIGEYGIQSSDDCPEDMADYIRHEFHRVAAAASVAE
jgi:hypothetical protein